MLIGISGKKQSGKDAFGKAIGIRLRAAGYQVSYDRFAAPLKAAVSEIFGWSLASLEDESFKARTDWFWDVTPRAVLQYFGTDLMRQAYPGVWVKSLIRRYETLRATRGAEKYCMIVTDMRFPDEADAVRAAGGTLVRMQRRVAIDEASQHISETALDDWDQWDWIVGNNSTLQDLEDAADCVAQGLLSS